MGALWRQGQAGESRACFMPVLADRFYRKNGAISEVNIHEAVHTDTRDARFLVFFTFTKPLRKALIPRTIHENLYFQRHTR